KILRDITERRRVEEALHVSEQRFRRLVESNVIGIMLMDAKGRVLEANEALLKMLGCTADDLVNGRVQNRSLTAPGYAAVDDWMEERLKISGVCPPTEKEFVRKDGGMVAVLVGMVRLEENEKQVLCFVIDGRERRAAQDALQKGYDELELRVRERTR